MTKMKWSWAGGCALALAMLAVGCAGKALGSAMKQDEVTGKHPSNWIQVHYADYQTAPETCKTCHGSTVDPAQAGGISQVSCFSCHTKGVNHPAGWSDHAQHGRNGAQLAPTTSTVPTMAGMAHCQKCHGADYAGGLSGVSCKGCHTTAPHPVKPWSNTDWTKSTHVKTDQANVGACVPCHTAGANSTMKPKITAQDPLGSTPGCFNNTLCHGTNIARP